MISNKATEVHYDRSSFEPTPAVAHVHQPLERYAEEDTKSANTTTKQAKATEDFDLDTPIDYFEILF